jgi:collagen type VI alpha
MNAMTGLCAILALVALLDVCLAERNCTNVTLADVYFLDDSSNSIARVGWTRELNFTCNVAKAVSFGPKGAQFAFGQFSTAYEHVADLNSFSSANSFCEQVLATKQLKWNTNTAGALDAVRDGNYLFDESKGARTDVAKVVVVITDGQSDNTTATQEAAAKIRSQGVKIIAVGVGSVNIAELDGISGRTGSALSVKTFSAIEEIREELLQRICEADPPTTVPPCVTVKPTAVFFALDSSSSIGSENFAKSVAFARDTANGVDVEYRGACTYGTHVRKVSAYTDDKELFITRLEGAQYQNSTTQTDLAIDYFVDQSSTIATDIQKIEIVITDGKSTEPEKTQASAQRAREAGSIILAVAVGDSVDKEELDGITGDPNLVFYADDFNDLANRVRELTQTVCAVTPRATPTPAQCGDVSTSTTTTTTTTTEEPTTTTKEPTTTPPTLKPCPPAKPLDIFYCIDASGSIGVENFGQNIVLLTLLTNALTVGPDNANVATDVYGTHDYPVHGLLSDKEEIIEKIKQIPYRNSSTGTDLCIDHAVQVLTNGRADAVKIMIVVTDGKSNNATRTAASADAAHAAGITGFAVGVGSDVSEPELNRIASDPGKVFHAPSYDQILVVAEALSKGTCDQSNHP